MIDNNSKDKNYDSNDKTTIIIMIIVRIVILMIPSNNLGSHWITRKPLQRRQNMCHNAASEQQMVQTARGRAEPSDVSSTSQPPHPSQVDPRWMLPGDLRRPPNKPRGLNGQMTLAPASGRRRLAPRGAAA